MLVISDIVLGSSLTMNINFQILGYPTRFHIWSESGQGEQTARIRLCAALTQQTGLVWYQSCWGCCEQKMYDLVLRNLSFGGTSQFSSWLHHKPAPGMPFCFPVTQFTFWEIGEKHLTLWANFRDSYIKDTSVFQPLGYPVQVGVSC